MCKCYYSYVICRCYVKVVAVYCCATTPEASLGLLRSSHAWDRSITFTAYCTFNTTRSSNLVQVIDGISGLKMLSREGMKPMMFLRLSANSSEPSTAHGAAASIITNTREMTS